MESCSAYSLAKNLPGKEEQHALRADKMRGWEDAGAVSQEEDASSAPDLPVSLQKIMTEVISSGLGK